MKRNICLVFALLLMLNSFSAEIKIHCVVYNPNGIDYSEIAILLIRDGKKMNFEGNNQGDFIIKNVQIGVYAISIESNIGKTALNSYLVKNVIVDKDNTVLDEQVYLPKLTSCGDFITGDGFPYRDTAFFSSGNIKSIGKYKLIKKNSKFKKVRNGMWKFYYESGFLQEEVLYFKGSPAYIKNYSSLGKINYCGGYIDGCQNGEWIYYNEGNEIVRLNYVLGKELIIIDCKYLRNLFLSHKKILKD